MSPSKRCAVLLLPLFSVRMRGDAGVGEIPALPALADFARACGCSAVQLLPMGEAVSGDHSPYSSRSAFALDPIFIGLDHVPELSDGGPEGPGWERAIGRHLRVAVDRCRAADALDPQTVRLVKAHALATAFARFRERHWAKKTARAKAFEEHCREEAVWLDDYALFRALETAEGGASWLEWPAPLRDRDPKALSERRAALADLILFFKYQQFVADEQWSAARKACAATGVRIAGDLPFMVARDSADLWAHRAEFFVDKSVGAPPDALAPEGQDWDLPPYRWEAQRANGYAWIRARARRLAELFDLYRVDHVVGYFRTYVIDRGKSAKEGAFHPAEEPTQVKQAEAVLRAMAEPGAELVAEDLGTIPPFVYTLLERLALPGFKVLRWERDWDAPGRPFREPKRWPARSVATSGTHDTTTLAAWWEREIGPDDRRALLSVPSLSHLRPALDRGDGAYTDEIREGLLEGLAASGSDILILPLQDILGTREQVNVPGTVSPGNWTYRTSFLLEEIFADPERRRRIEKFAAACRANGRG